MLPSTRGYADSGVPIVIQILMLALVAAYFLTPHTGKTQSLYVAGAFSPKTQAPRQGL